MINKHLWQYIIIMLIVIIYIVYNIITFSLTDLLYVGKITANDSYHYFLSIFEVERKTAQQVSTPSTFPKWESMQKSAFFVAAVPITIKNKQHLFVGGGKNQDDMLLTYQDDDQDGKMIDVIKGTGLSSKSPSHGGVSVDMDKDGYTDLIVAREDGVTLYKNNKDGTFTGKKILEEKKDTIPIAIAVTDYNKDGNIDLYISQFIHSKLARNFQFNNPNHARKNIMLKNTGNMVFVDTLDQTGTAGNQNTFTSIFTDLNKDTWPDLVVANDTGEVEIYENPGDSSGKFIKHKVPSNYGFWMGIAAGDVDNDGDTDLFFTNVGTTVPEGGSSRGSKETGLKKHQIQNHNHLLLRNDGEFKFVDITKSVMKDYGFSWGAIFEDINLDGKLDLLFSQNYVLYPTHKFNPLPGKVLLSSSNSKNSLQFNQIHDFQNKHISQTPLAIDVDGDGKKEIVWINVNAPVKIYKNHYATGNYLNVKLPDDNEFINALIIVTTPTRSYTGRRPLPQENSYIRENIVGGIGFGGDQGRVHTFGLDKEQKINKVTVKTIYGKEYGYDNAKINSLLLVEKNV
jgi:hypothetical protein